ncbi:MAG TPA: DUF4347 domain-containing protein, partial [Gammaproteobacteria bacterium]|nr:DUF4347 domain-containing protein [Gammaproteobacteria bacterium]
MARRTSKTVTPPRCLIIEELEPRILYSADFLPEVPGGVAPAPVAEHRVAEEARSAPESFIQPESDEDDILIFVDPDNKIPGEKLPETGIPQNDPEIIVLYEQQDDEPRVETTRNEIVFVDTDVPDYQQLLDDLLNSPDQNRQIKVVLLNNEEDGIRQITEALSHTNNLDAIHLISHGSAGNIDVGTTRINAQSLQSNAAEIQGWRDALNSDADFLIYGCDLASTTQGINLVDQLSQLTGADVAASDDKTGNAALGGDWDLEYISGEIETVTLAPVASESSWNGVLAAGLTSTGELLVNSTTGSVQETSGESRGSRDAVAMDSNGNYVVVWTDSSTDGSGYGVFAQRFDATGTKQGTEFQINETSADNQYWASVTMDSSGNFTVTWTSVNQDGTASSIYARQFNADGTAKAAGEFKVNTSTGAQSSSSIAMASDGRFIIAWQGNGSSDSDGIYGRLYNAAGNATTSEFLINTTTSGLQFDPVVAMNDNGESAIVWNNGTHSYLELINASGVVAGVETQVNAFSSESKSAVAIDNNGQTIVAFRYLGSGDDGIYFRRFDTLGNDIDGRFSTPPSVDTAANLDATAPSIAMDRSSGNFIVTWEKAGDGSGTAVYAKAFKADKSLLWDTVQINVTTGGTQEMASVALLDTDNYVVVWKGNGTESGNIDTDGVFLRQYGTPNSVPTATISVLSAINEGDSLALDASASSDPDGDNLNYAWDLNNDGTYGDVVGVNPTVSWVTLQSFSIDDDGSYTLGLQVDDGKGGISTTSTTLTVGNIAPVISLSGNNSTTAGQNYTLNLSAIDPGNDTISQWSINWGDGTIDTINGNPSSVSHSY